MIEHGAVMPNGAVLWSIAEDDVCIQEYEGGIGWEERASARLEGRSADACMARGKLLHLRSSGWMRSEMKRQGLRSAHA